MENVRETLKNVEKLGGLYRTSDKLKEPGSLRRESKRTWDNQRERQITLDTREALGEPWRLIANLREPQHTQANLSGCVLNLSEPQIQALLCSPHLPKATISELRRTLKNP